MCENRGQFDPDIVFEKHLDFIGGALRKLGVLDDDFESTLSEVFLKVSKNLAAFEGRSKLTTWLWGVARNVVRERRRRRQNHMLRHSSGEDAVDALPAPTATNPEALMAEAEQSERKARLLARALQQLDEPHREVMAACIDGLDVSEVARLLGIKLKTAYARRQAGKQKLIRALRRLGWREAERTA